MGAMLKWEILEEVAILSTDEHGWSKELNLVKFGNYEPTLNIRTWSPDHTRMGRGIRLTKEEAQRLIDALTVYLARKDNGE